MEEHASRLTAAQAASLISKATGAAFTPEIIERLVWIKWLKPCKTENGDVYEEAAVEKLILRLKGEPMVTREVAHMFRVTPTTVIRWAEKGKLTCGRTLGGHRRFNGIEACTLKFDPNA